VRTGHALGLLIGGLTAAIVARSTVIPSDWHFPYNVAIAAFALAVAWGGGLRSAGLGLARQHLGEGVLYGFVVVVAVTVALVGAATFGLLDDDRTATSGGEMLLRVLVIIPIGTVLMEELAFRGALYGLLERSAAPRRAMLVGSVLFGLWHVPPILNDGAWVVIATLAGTTVAGAGFIWLRRQSNSLVAPLLAHLSTNSVTFALSWAVTR
jgi:membrane protease YdiL (CAAX protease family)